MLRSSIKAKILAVALGLIVLMAIAAVLSLTQVRQLGLRLEQLTATYLPAYADLARANIRSLEEALALRRMVIAKTQSPPDEEKYISERKLFYAKRAEAERFLESALASINELIGQRPAFADLPALARIETRIAAVLQEGRRHLNAETEHLLTVLGTGNADALSEGLSHVDAIRDEKDEEIKRIRSDMLALVHADATAILHRQREVIWLTVMVTAAATVIGVVVSIIVSTGLTRPIRRLLEAMRAVEAGNLNERLVARPGDEIAELTNAFDQMVGQLRLKELMRETFGKYIDPRVVEGLIGGPAVIGVGQRHVMTVLFCDLENFTGLSEAMTPQALVTIMNRFFSRMSTQIRSRQGIIDKYIGDAIMAYWGPPFIVDERQAALLACFAALDLVSQLEPLRAELPDLTGFRNVPIALNIRIGIATGEVLAGNIGCDVMMSYTVIGDAVNLAARLEDANKGYGSRILASEATALAAGDGVEVREIDQMVALGMSTSRPVFEVMAPKGALTAGQESLRTNYAQGLAAYRAQRLDEACSYFKCAIQSCPGDGPSLAFLRRLEDLQHSGPPASLNGALRLAQQQ